jgi:hypothetical protein
MWGLVILAKAGITLWLLETLSTADFVLVKAGAIITLTLTAAAVTIVWSAFVGRREGLLAPAWRETRPLVLSMEAFVAERAAASGQRY